MDDYYKLIEKLRKIEALHSGATTAGERDAAAEAHERLAARLTQARSQRPVECEYKFSLENDWSRSLMTALLRRNGYEPYRRRGQRHTTVMVKMPKAAGERVWAEFQELDRELCGHLNLLAIQIIHAAVWPEKSDLPMLESDPPQK